MRLDAKVAERRECAYDGAMDRLVTTLPLALLCVLSLACGQRETRSTRGEVESASVPQQRSQASEQKPPGLSGALVRPAPRRLVAIGDLHGDLSATRRALRLASAIDGEDRWIGGELVVVQTGDCIDRGSEDKEVLDLLDRLREQAQKSGGALILLNGNHELMNVAQDFRYVAEASYASFDGPSGRRSAFLPGGPYARMLATHPLFVKVGDSVFVHGGILLKHVVYGLNKLDDEVRSWLLGERAAMPEPVSSEDGVVWTRLYSTEPQPADCAELRQVLTLLSARRMIVGHTVQPHEISSACEGQVWRIDVGLSKHYGGPMQVLAIEDNAPRVLIDSAGDKQPSAAPAH